MTKLFKTIARVATVLLIGGSMKAQMSGAYSIPADFPTVAAATASLNSVGVSGPVTINIPAGYSETVTAVISLSATGTSSTPIVFQKSGVGANPVLVAYSGGTATPASAVQDGVFRLVGSDYVTINGLDIMDPNTTNPSTMEYGYGLFKASATDGCQNNTIKNCSITLNRVNNATGTSPATDGSRGIDVVNATPNAHTTGLTITAASGSNSNNTFYSNSIQNCNIGISLIGYAASSPFATADTGNDVGGSSAATGNTILNYGGAAAATNPAAGIRTLAQYNFNASYNRINNNNGSGVNHPSALRGIYMNTATSANATISNNTVTVNGGGTTSQITAIENAAGSTAASNTITITNNLITNCTYGTATSGGFTGILSTSSAFLVNISNNIVSGNTLPGTGTFTGIDGGGSSMSGAVALNSNTVVSNTKTGASGTFYCMRVSTASVTVNGNTINNNAVPTTTGASSSSIYGIYDISSPTFEIYTNNNIDNLSIGGTSTSTGHSAYGLYTNTSSSSVKTFSNNIIHTISIANTLAGGTIYGIYHALTGTTNIYKNKIYDMSTGGASGNVYGVYISSGGTMNIYNNLIGDLRTPAASASIPLAGIYISGGTLSNIYFNSVHLNATSTGANFSSAALYASTTPSVDVRNNILMNISTPAGTGVTAAYRRSGTSLTSYVTTSNKNLLYAGTPSSVTVLFYDGTNAYQTIGAFKTAVSPREVSSVTEAPPFVSTTGSNANFLNLNTTTPTQVESGASPVASVPDDYAGTIRNATTPDIGAWEGNFTIADLSAPGISAIGYVTSACNLTARTVTANISDASGTATGAFAPRLYYKVNSNPYTSVQGTLISGTPTNGVWSFALAYSVVVSDVISYYIAAQDIASTPNVGANPSTGFSATDVNTITTPPTTPLSYVVAGSLGGVYTVGSSGNYPTLTVAANAYNTSCLTSSVTFQLIDPAYSAAETFPIIFLNNADASSTNSLLIVPSSGNNVTVSTSTTAASVFKFLNARYITMDGVNSGGSSLSVVNTNSTSANAEVWIASTSGTGPGCNTIGLKNMTLTGNSTTSTQYGIVAGVDGASPSTTGGFDNDNITITGNTILRNYYGIYANGTASLTTGGLDNWNISANTIGPVTSGTLNIGFAGIYLQNMLNLSVNSNKVQNVITASSSNGGIYLASGINAAAVSQNTVNMVTTSSTGSGSSSISGIYLGLNVINSSVSKNIISSVYNTNTSGYGARGIMLVTSVAASNDVVENNMISDIVSYSDPTAPYWPIGIALESSTGGVDITYNSISLSGSHPGLTGGTGSAGLYVNTGSAAGLRIRDNIFSNTYDNSSSTGDFAYSIYSTSSVSSYSVMDYNDYYVGGSANTLVLGYLGSAQTTLSGIQSSFGGNINSQNVAPVFTSATDLHLIPASNVALDNLGTPITGITTDIDGQTRSATPDMGADEFAAPTCTSATGGTQGTSSFSACNGQTLALSTSGASSGMGILYQWMISSTPGGPYSNVSGGSGATSVSYTTAPLATGVYYYVLQATCTSASLTGVSNEATVTINAVPSASATSNSPVCSGQALNLSASTDIGTSFMWTGPGSFTSTSQNPTVSSAMSTSAGTYSLMVSTPSCTSAVATLTVSVGVAPPAITVTPTSTVYCAGGSVNLNITAGADTLNFGTQANQNTASTTAAGYPAPYTVYYGGQRMQTLITAAELTAAGFVPGENITSVQFPVVSKGANWGTSTNDLKSFQVNIGSTTATALTSFQNGLTNVVAPMNYTPVVGYNNVHMFSTPYAWDGVSNIILETSFSNNILGATADLVTQYNSPTTFTSTIVYRVDSQTPLFVANSNTVSYAYMARPDLKLNGTSVGSYTWGPAAGLSSTSGQSVTANPTTSTVYTVTSANGACVSNAAVSVSVVPIPTVSIAASNTLICSGNTTTLTASGATTYTWTGGIVSSSITPTPTTSVTYTVRGANGSCTSTAVQSISVTPGPTVTAASSSSLLCTGQTATLTAGGTATSYSWSTGSTSTVVAVSPSVTTTYTLSGSNGVCSVQTILTQSVSTCTGIDELTLAGINVFPNPNNGVINISIPEDLSAHATIEVYDAIGKLIVKESLSRQLTTLNLSKFDNGVYLYKILNGNEAVKIGRLIKQ